MRWLKRTIDRVLWKMGLIKIPSGYGGTHSALLGFSNLGSARKQCEAYQSHVYKCVTLIYRRAISVPWALNKMRGDESEEIKRHPFIDLMARPNPYFTARQMKGLTFMHLDLTGRAMWLIVRNGLGRPAEIWPLPIANFSELVFNKEKTDLTGFRFANDAGGTIVYPAEDVVYFRYPHPIYMLEGASPIQAMAYAYDTDLAVRVYQRNFFQNSARPDVVFETEQKIEPEDAQRLLLAWKQAHQGVDKSWEPAMLDQGLKINKVSLSAKDFEFAALAGWTKEDILEAYNVPPGKLGTVTDVNRANALGIDITFNSECISPRLDLFDETVSQALLPLYDTGLLIKHASCIPRDLEYDLKERDSNLKNKYTTINEERARAGMDPVAWGDAPFVAINEMQWGDDLGIVDTESRSGGKAEIKSPPAPLYERGEKGRREQAQALHERKVAARSRAMRAWLRKFFGRQKAGVLERLEMMWPRIEGATAGMSRKKVEDWIKENKGLVEDVNINLAEANRELADGAGPYMEGAVLAGGEDALGTLADDIVFDLRNPRVIGFMEDKNLQILDINRTTQEQIKKQLTEAIEQGEPVKKAADRVRKVFRHADDVRSLRIAQTEVNSAANFGTLEGYRQSGAVTGKEWLAGPDARPTHQEAARSYSGDGAIPLDQDFVVGSGSGPAPGSIGIPEEDIN